MGDAKYRKKKGKPEGKTKIKGKTKKHMLKLKKMVWRKIKD